MKLRLLTYNIHRAIGVDRRFRMGRIVDVLLHHDADVVLLQEVDVGVPRSRELDLALELAVLAGYRYHALGRNVALRKGHYGNATLSRFPIVRERNIDLTIEWRKRRGCQHTTIVMPGSSRTAEGVEVFNLHLGLSAVERAKQIALLLRCPEFRALPAHAPCLVGGDFNDWRSLLLQVFTLGLGFRSATLFEETGRSLNTFPAFAPRGALDRVFYRGGLHLERCQVSRLRVARVASDHLPVVVDFEI